MHCASCAHIIERTVKKIDGVNSIVVNSGTEKALIDLDENKTSVDILNQKLTPLGYTILNTRAHDDTSLSADKDLHAEHLNMHQTKKEKLTEINELKRKIYAALPLAVFSIFIMSWEIFAKYNWIPPIPETFYNFAHHLLPLFATYIFVTIGKPYILGVYRFFRYGKANMDTLIGLGTSVAFIYSFIIASFEKILGSYIDVTYTYYDVAIVVITFITLGKYLEARSKLKTGDAIEKLLDLQAKTALVLRDKKEIEIPIAHVQREDIVIIKPGQKIPTDGIVIEGSSFVDESMITGEPMPIEKNIGARVVAGTINTTGTFNFTTKKVGSETLLANIIKMVEEAQESKAPIQALADKISSIFVPIVLILAIIAVIAWLYFGIPTLGFSTALSFALTSFVGMLIIACPCALGLATPTAIIVGVGKGAREGILIKDAATLEALHTADVVVVDKTGTITEGKPRFTKIDNKSTYTDHEIISILATLESRSEHPIAHAIVQYAQEQNITLKNMSQFAAMKGKGLSGVIDGTEYIAGNIRIASDLQLSFDTRHLDEETHSGKTPILLANKNELFAIIYVADPIKPEVIETVRELHKRKKTVVMLTGDNKNTAEYIAKIVGIDQVIAEVTPEDKLHVIKDFQDKGHVVVMAGDGVNDAPALAQAHVGIAMSTGTDVAIASAGITLLGGDISKIVKAVDLSAMTMHGIKQNLFWAFIYNVIGIPLAAGAFYPVFGWLLSPVFAGFAMAMSSVSVISNSLRIKTKKL